MSAVEPPWRELLARTLGGSGRLGDIAPWLRRAEKLFPNRCIRRKNRFTSPGYPVAEGCTLGLDVVKGLYVSEHQPTISWRAVKRAGVAFARLLGIELDALRLGAVPLPAPAFVAPWSLTARGVVVHEGRRLDARFLGRAGEIVRERGTVTIRGTRRD